MSAPAVVIRVELEALAPMVFVDAVNDGEHDRLVDWLKSHPQLDALFDYVRELQNEAEAA